MFILFELLDFDFSKYIGLEKNEYVYLISVFLILAFLAYLGTFRYSKLTEFCVKFTSRCGEKFLNLVL
ncbi:hypothetical protein [Clostridium thermobutyricum]|uniref:hypothetical protein n=1 Tax=Clostridium thermobutyricum TaxID=29372 RepID=UPI001301EBF3|nr:hypothetical protein [Clostridium thermobutyricum]